MKFVMTRLPTLTKEMGVSKSKIAALLKKNGHEVQGKVTEETDFLVSEVETGTLKHKAAEENNVKVLGVKEFASTYLEIEG